MRQLVTAQNLNSDQPSCSILAINFEFGRMIEVRVVVGVTAKHQVFLTVFVESDLAQILY